MHRTQCFGQNKNATSLVGLFRLIESHLPRVLYIYIYTYSSVITCVLAVLLYIYIYIPSTERIINPMTIVCSECAVPRPATMVYYILNVLNNSIQLMATPVHLYTHTFFGHIIILLYYTLANMLFHPISWINAHDNTKKKYDRFVSQ